MTFTNILRVKLVLCDLQENVEIWSHKTGGL